MGRFDGLKTKGMPIEKVLDICLSCNTKEEAENVLREYEEQHDPEIARQNLGYIFGYASDNDIKKLYSLFPVTHPVFGEKFGREENKTTELENVKKSLQLSIDLLEKTIESHVRLQKSYDDLMENAKAVEVVGLKKPNLFPYIQQLNLQKQILLTLKFHVECNIEDIKKSQKRRK